MTLFLVTALGVKDLRDFSSSLLDPVDGDSDLPSSFLDLPGLW